MRQLKTFMRNRKKEMLWCGPCECRTLQCRRYANENCGCGEATVDPKATWDADYDWYTIIVGEMIQLWFTVVPKDFNYIVNLSNNNFVLYDSSDDWTHHTITLQAVRFVENNNSTVVTIEDWDGNVLASTNIYTMVHVAEVSAPSENAITTMVGGYSTTTFTYTPVDANPGSWWTWIIEDDSICWRTNSWENWTMTLNFIWVNEGSTTFTYWSWSDPDTKYVINITVDLAP